MPTFRRIAIITFDFLLYFYHFPHLPMQRVVAVLQYLFFPFELLGTLILALPLFLWKGLTFLLGRFLLSPLGLLVPMTFLVLLFFVTQVSKTPFQIAEQYTKELQVCREKDIAAYTALLIQLDEAGLSGLVTGINSERQAVFNACFEGLQNEIKKHQQYRNPKNPFRWELQLSKAMLEQAPQFRISAQVASAVLTRSLIRSITEGIELSYKREQNGDLQKANRNCIQILDLLETANNRQFPAGESEISQQKETAALFHPRYAHPVLMAENGKPLFNSDGIENNLNEELTADTLSVPNAERLIAYYQSPQFLAVQNQSTSQNQPHTLRNKGTLPAQMQPSTLILSDVSDKTASEYAETPVIDETGEVNIVSDYISNKKTAPKKLKQFDKSQLSETINEKISATDDGFITNELQSIPLMKISSLSTVKLMKLLHSEDSKIAAEARNTLAARDGFREIHLRMAYELYHADSAVRKELVRKLPQTAGIPQHIWLLELMNDSDADVRYQAATYLMTASDPALRRMLAEKGKQDTDQRIVNLAEKISGTSSENPRR